MLGKIKYARKPKVRKKANTAQKLLESQGPVTIAEVS
jgi:hypothetical protein